MHISFILPDVKGGGAQKMIINLANYYADQGHKTDLVLFQNEGTYKDLINNDVNIVVFNKKKALHALKPLKLYFQKNKNIDAVISSMYYMNIITLMANIASGNTQKIIATERNTFTSRVKAESNLHQILFKKLVRFFYPKSSHIIGISNGVRDDLINLLGSKNKTPISTIYNPVVSPDFENKIKQEVDNIFPSDISLKLIASGRLVEQKDYPTVLKALSYYKETYGDDFHLVVLGDGALKEGTIELSKELGLQSNITFKGFVENPLTYMKQADIFLISSAWEGFGNVIVEALYCGLKIVSTDCPSGPSEILEEGKYGLLTSVGNHVKFSEAIHEAYQTNVSPENQKKRAMDFTTEKIALEFQKIIKSINV